MSDIRRWQPTARMNHAVAHGGLDYTAGQVAQDHPDSPAEIQTTEVLERIDSLLAEAGTDKTRILTASVFLANMADFDDMNRAWDN